MTKPRIFLVASSFFLFSAGLAYYLTLYFQVSSYTILHHHYRFLPIPFFLSLAFILLLLVVSWIFSAHLEVKYFKTNLSSSLWENYFPYLPLCFFLLTPLLLNHYLTKEDLKIRLNLLLLFVCLSLLYLRLVRLIRTSKGKLSFLNKWEMKFSSLSLKAKLAILFLVALVVYNLCTFILVSKGITFSGDEPYYLLTTHSLLKDKDINLANNYAQQDYFSFYSREDHPRLKLRMYARQGRKGKDYIYPINMPGISVLMLPFYWLSQLFQGKTLTFILKGSLSIWAVLLGLQVYLFTRELWGKERISLLLWFLYSFTSPVLFYSIHLYPEIPIAFFSFYIFRKVYSPKNLSIFQYFFLGLLLSTFLWFGLKYNLIFWPLLIVSLYFLLKHHKARLKVLCFLALPFLSFALFYYYIYSLYGTFSPLAIYEGVMTPEKMVAFKEAVLEAPVSLRIDTLLDYFLDQRDGLLLYSPLYFFTFLGLIEIFRKSKRDFLIILFISLPFLLNYAFLTHRQGYSPQGRILTPLSWLGAIMLGYFIMHNRKKLYSFLFWSFCLISLTVVALQLLHPFFLYQPTTHEFTSRPAEMFVYLSNIFMFLPSSLPSFIKVNNIGYLPNYFWILALIIFILFYTFLKKEIRLKTSFHYFFSFFLVLGFFFLWCLFPRSVLYAVRTFQYSPQKTLGFYLYPMGKGVIAKKEAELYLHREGSYKILFSSRRQLEKLQMTFGSDKGEYEAKLTFFDLPVFEGKTSFERKELVFPSSAYFPFKNLYLYEINLNLKKLTAESMLIDPYYFQVLPFKE